MNSLLEESSHILFSGVDSRKWEGNLLSQKKCYHSQRHRNLIPKKSDLPRRRKLIGKLIGSSTNQLAKYLSTILRNFTGKTSFAILNLFHRVSLLPNLIVNPDVLLVSFDITSLFTKVSISDPVTIIPKIVWNCVVAVVFWTDDTWIFSLETTMLVLIGCQSFIT